MPIGGFVAGGVVGALMLVHAPANMSVATLATSARLNVTI
jgi:hypothetical protein